MAYLERHKRLRPIRAWGIEVGHPHYSTLIGARWFIPKKDGRVLTPDGIRPYRIALFDTRLEAREKLKAEKARSAIVTRFARVIRIVVTARVERRR
jgi:hypothetical protein